MSSNQQERGPSVLSDVSIKASVGKIVTVVKEGKSPFVVAYPLAESATTELTEQTTITFSLDYWKGRRPPELGQVVALEQIERFVTGWRARLASPVFPINSSEK